MWPEPTGATAELDITLTPSADLVLILMSAEDTPVGSVPTSVRTLPAPFTAVAPPASSWLWMDGPVKMWMNVTAILAARSVPTCMARTSVTAAEATS